MQFMKERLKTKFEWSTLAPFTPGVRSSVAMIRVDCKDDVYDFIRKWKAQDEEDIKFKGAAIRARADKPREQRKANGKIWSMAEYLRTTFQDKLVHADFRNSSVWLGDWEVKWDMDTEAFKWLEDGISDAAVVVDRAEAEAKCRRE